MSEGHAYGYQEPAAPTMRQSNGSKGQLVAKLAQKHGVDQVKLLNALKSTVFSLPSKKNEPPREVTNEEMMTLLIVAHRYNLDPFMKELYAFPDKKGGIVPVVGVDGWLRIINSHPEIDGMEFRYSDQTVIMNRARECPEWIEVHIYRKDRSMPVVVREYLDEVYREPFEGVGRNGEPYTVDGPWQSHTKRMLRHKGIIQAARVAFGFTGIYDEDEALGRIGAINVDFKQLSNNPAPALPDSPVTKEQLFMELWSKMPDVEKDSAGIEGQFRRFIGLTARAQDIPEENVIKEGFGRPEEIWKAFLAWNPATNKSKTPESEHPEPPVEKAAEKPDGSKDTQKAKIDPPEEPETTAETEDNGSGRDAETENDLPEKENPPTVNEIYGPKIWPIKRVKNYLGKYYPDVEIPEDAHANAVRKILRDILEAEKFARKRQQKTPPPQSSNEGPGGLFEDEEPLPWTMSQALAKDLDRMGLDITEAEKTIRAHFAAQGLDSQLEVENRIVPIMKNWNQFQDFLVELGLIL